MTELLPAVHPALPLLFAAVLLPLLPLQLRRILLVVAPVVGLVNLIAVVQAVGLDAGSGGIVGLGVFELSLLRVDALSRIFGILFHAAAFVGGVYALHLRDRMQPATALAYAGSAIGVVFAGDLLTVFVFWELLAVTSVFQIWARGSERAYRSGMRYLYVNISSGLLLLAGAALRYQETGDISFVAMTPDTLGPQLILLALGIKCCFPLAHTWLVDSYPEATVTGTVFLSSFTTKAAVYALARGFAGVEMLVWVGVTMAMFPIFFAVIENDLRRVLGYSMINQIGFMVAGVGLGAGLGVNGAVAHAFNDVFFKGLLFMSMGAVLFRTGRINGSELGGLYKTMPQTAGLCMVGAASISAFPGFSGFVSKSMVMSQAAHEGYVIPWLLLLFASAGVFHHAGIKIPFFAFFAHDSGLRPKEAPLNMRAAMLIGAVVSITIGCFPRLLYNLLPYATDYNPYDVTHIVTQLQLLFFSALAFVTLMLTKIYPPELRAINLDVDWFPRRAIPALAAPILRAGGNAWAGVMGVVGRPSRVVGMVRRLHQPQGLFGEPWPTGATTFWAALLLAAYLIWLFWV